MTLLDFSNNCDITTSSFREDLLSYSLKDGKIVWSDGTEQEYAISEDIFSDSDVNDFWTPVFIRDDKLINNKLISHYGSITGDSSFASGRIGIEDFIIFSPKFKNWNVSSGSMTIDWILNRSRLPKIVEAGLMYWKRKKKAIKGPITSFPIYSKIKHKDIIYIKIDNNIIRRIDPDPVAQSVFKADSTLGFNYTEQDADTSVVDLKPPGSDTEPEFILFGSDDIEVWIPDGDQLLYYNTQSEKKRNNIDRIASRSYISGALYKYYNIFYNSLTAKEKLVKITDHRSTHRLRQYKKLAHSLSTSPFNSEFFIALLSKPSLIIENSINDYLASNINSIDTDIDNLSSVLAIISKEYSIYELQNNSNIIKNKDQVFAKLLNKYGANLQLSGEASISYRPKLTHGDSVIIEEIGETLVTKNLKSTVVSNNKIINIGNLSVETSIGQTISSILLKHKNETTNNIVLYNSVKPELKEDSNINILMEKNTNVSPESKYRLSPSKIPIVQDYDPDNIIFYWGPEDSTNVMATWKEICPRFKAVNTNLTAKYIDFRFPNQAQEIIDREFQYIWTKISGPECRFVDLAKSQTNKSFRVAYTNEVLLVPSSTGRYVIQCAVSSPYGSYTKTKTIFIVDGREQIVDFSGRVTTTYRNNPNFGSYIKEGETGSAKEEIFKGINAGTSLEKNRINIDSIDLDEYRSESKPIFLNKDKLKVFISGLDAIAIHRNGLFCPIRTNYYVEKNTTNSRPIDKLDINSSYKFMFQDISMPIIIPKTSDSLLSIIYQTNNTIIKLDRIILRNIRNETKECSQCYSLYQPKFTSFIGGVRSGVTGPGKPSFSRINKSPEAFTLQRYLPDGPGGLFEYYPSGVKEYIYPTISSDIAPPLTTYGGYGYDVLDKLTINNLSSLEKPGRNILNDGLIAKLPNILPAVTGYKLDYKDDFESLDDSVRNYKFCYQENIIPSGYIDFTKGSFIPESGWVVGDTSNLSSVLKFNPGARKSFCFAGPGILNLSNSTNTDKVSANTFSSSIELQINPEIQWEIGDQFCPQPNAENANRNKKAEITGTHNMKNQLTKELADQLVSGPNAYHHGYRLLNGGDPKLSERNIAATGTPQNDEFNIEADELNNKFTYYFNVVGPNYPIGLDKESEEFIEYYIGSGIDPGAEGDGKKVRDFIESREGLNIRNPRINNLSIKDVEIKLNFLNYVNTKNLIIWLEVEFSSSERKTIGLKTSDNGTQRAPSQIKSDNNFIDQFISNTTHRAFKDVRNEFFTSDKIFTGNSKIDNHLKDLTDLNSTESAGDNIILYLMNQETIQNKEYNFSLKFSDSANKHNVLYDQNLYSTGVVNPNQHIISNGDSVNPSKHTNNNLFTNSHLVNLNKINRLNINNNTFHKLSDRNLFKGISPETPEGCSYLFSPYNASTIFTLHITLLEEEDEMLPMDTIVNSEQHTNISSIENSLSSANLFNNLCSWELILHTEDVKKPVTSQVNSLANYGGTDSLGLIEYGSKPKYPGYGFIADLKDSKFLLPLVNINAPTTFFQNYNACEYTDSELIGKGFVLTPPRFPTEALIAILAGTAVGGMGGSLVGTIVGGLGLGYTTGFQSIFNYLAESRKVPILENAQRETFDIEYGSYPFGNSDKILLNISKDNIFWYKVEASIFKLSNTPALPLKKYSLIKSNNKLFTFDFVTISNRKQIIDDIFLPYIINKAMPEDVDEETKIKYQNIDDKIYDNFNFMSVDELVFTNKLIHSENIFQYINAPNETIIMIDHSMPYSLISVDDVIRLNCESTYATVKSKSLVYKEGRHQTVLVINIPIDELVGCSSLLLPEDVVVICDSESSPISSFGLVSDQPPNDTIPDRTFSTNSLGSYGDGSSVKNKNILSRKVQINKIDSIYNQLNSWNSDKYYYNELSIVLPSGDNEKIMAPPVLPRGIPIKISNKLESYPVYYDALKDNIIDNSFYHIYNNTFNNLNLNATDNTENIQNLLDQMMKDNRSYTKDNIYNMIYLKVKNNNTINQLYRNTIASLTIENNYTYKDTIERITEDQLKTLTDRLAIIDNSSDDPIIDSLIGDPAKTSLLLDYDSIFYTQQHYNSLPDDAPDCSRSLPTITCYKDRTFTRLQQLYNERTEILKLLQNQAIINKAKIFRTQEDFEKEPPVSIEGTIKLDDATHIQLNNSDKLNKDSLYKIEYIYSLDPIKQKYHTNDGGIIPDQKAKIVVNRDRSLHITYEKVSNNYYWINIDPKQSISIAEEMRPRVLKSIKYQCANTTPLIGKDGVEFMDLNNICPDFLHVDLLENETMKIEGRPGGTTYSFKEDFINKQKDTWKNKVWGWKTQTIERRFRINAEKPIPGRGNFTSGRENSEILVTAVETYEVALDQLEAGIKSAIDAGLSNKEAIELLIEEGLMKNDFSGDVYGKLKNSSGTFINNPSRVYNIFNLDNTKNLKVQFRKAPRAMRGIDAIGTILRYGENTSYRPQGRPPLDPLDVFGIGRVESLINNFYQWRCLQKDPGATKESGGSLLTAITPEFFQLLNEMVFRSFFGSVDNIENKTDTLRSLYDFEMIPYEYFTGKPPIRTDFDGDVNIPDNPIV